MEQNPQDGTLRFPRRNSTAGFRLFEGQATIVLPDGQYIKVLNESGSRMWELMDGTRDVGAIAAVIAGEYGISAETAERDVREFVEILDRNRMLEGS